MVKEFFKRLFKGAEGDTLERQSKLITHRKSIGTTGTAIYAGYPYEEYLQDLLGSQRAKVFDKMRRSDPQIAMCLNAVKSPIKSALWEIEPYDQNDEQSKQEAEFVKWNLFDGMDKTFSQFVSEALTYIEFGHSVFEIIDGVVFNHKQFGTKNTIKSLAWRSPKTIERWNVDPNTDKLVSVSQWSNGDLMKTVDIPADFLLLFSLNKEGSNYEGISAIRPCYGNWFRKNNYLKLNAIGIEKFAIPTPIVEIPNGKESGTQFDSLVEVLENYLTHENNYMTIPEGWKVTLNNSVYDPEKVEISIDNEDKRMVKSFMANFLELGMNGFGSQSLSFDLSDFFLGAIDHLASNICEVINQQLIPRIIQMNYGEREGYPKLKHSGITDKVGKELAEIFELLIRNKVVTPDDVLEQHARKRFGLPERSSIGVRQIQSPQPPSVPMLSERLTKLRTMRG